MGLLRSSGKRLGGSSSGQQRRLLQSLGAPVMAGRISSWFILLLVVDLKMVPCRVSEASIYICVDLEFDIEPRVPASHTASNYSTYRRSPGQCRQMMVSPPCNGYPRCVEIVFK